MSVQNGERLATKQDLADMYQGILPYLGGMPEVVANKFSKGDLYSTEEKMIGQWINGKPLYQRAFSLTIPTTENETYIAVESDIEDCIETFGYASFSDGTWMCLSNSDITDKRSFYAQTQKDASKSMYGKLRFFFQGTKLLGHPAVIVAKYTKISDTAISIGDSTDYSTEEKIVGTWINGKPLYQKTIIGSFTPPSVNRVYNELVNLMQFNVDKVIEARGFIKESNGYFKFLNVTDTEGAYYTLSVSDDNKLKMLTCGNSTLIEYTITIQYTKTTGT